MSKREVTAAEWLTQIKLQPEEVARLLAYETRYGNLVTDEHGYVWHGGIGPGYGTSFQLKEPQ